MQAHIEELDKLARKVKRLADEAKTELKRENTKKVADAIEEIDRVGRKLRQLAETMASLDDS